MEKFGIADDDLISGLRDEEHNLMVEVGRHMSIQEKSASENMEYQRLQSRLQQVRDKITEHDLKKMQTLG